jgi:hypothetical protein
MATPRARQGYDIPIGEMDSCKTTARAKQRVPILKLPGELMTQDASQPGEQEEQAPAMPFRTLLYRFLFFDWLFRDVSAAKNLFERHVALQHNRFMSRYLPTYFRRWSVLAVFDFGLGFLFERTLQATLLSAWFFTCSCLTVTGMVVIAAAWVFLTFGRIS